MAEMKDAKVRLRAARENLSRGDYAGCVRDSQACIELSVKSLLKSLDIQYKPNHDVSDLLPIILKKIEPHIDKVQLEAAKKDLAKIAIAISVLGSLREYATYGVDGIEYSADDLFRRSYISQLVRTAYRLALQLHVRIARMEKVAERIRLAKMAAA